MKYALQNILSAFKETQGSCFIAYLPVKQYVYSFLLEGRRCASTFLQPAFCLYIKRIYHCRSGASAFQSPVFLIKKATYIYKEATYIYKKTSATSRLYVNLTVLQQHCLRWEYREVAVFYICLRVIIPLAFGLLSLCIRIVIPLLSDYHSITLRLRIDVSVCGILLDELSARLHIIAHKHREYLVSFCSILDGYLLEET